MDTFNSLTKAQHAIMGALLKSDLAADHIKPATLGALCAKRLVNVKDGVVMGVGLAAYGMRVAFNKRIIRDLEIWKTHRFRG